MFASFNYFMNINFDETNIFIMWRSANIFNAKNFERCGQILLNQKEFEECRDVHICSQSLQLLRKHIS
jgi:hypothetical protein